MRHVDDRSFLLIERYDRTRGAGGQFVRLHQEDFAQALGVRSERKYASDGGPTFKDSFALLRQAITHPARAISKLTDAAIFNLVIGNADAHAKNFSLLHIDGTIRLAPRSEEHTSELQSLMRISYAVFCLKQKTK